MVRLAGIEPTTPWFVAKYSIQLSYSRTAVDCSIGGITGAEPILTPRRAGGWGLPTKLSAAARRVQYPN